MRERKLTLNTFYASNVEQYLESGRQWSNWTANLERLPRGEHSVILRTGRSAVRMRWAFGAEPISAAAARTTHPGPYTALMRATRPSPPPSDAEQPMLVVRP
jgi:hypothetical protein